MPLFTFLAFFFSCDSTSLEKHDAVYGQNAEYAQAKISVFDQSMRVDQSEGGEARHV